MLGASADFSTHFIRKSLIIMLSIFRKYHVEKSADAPSIASITKHIL